MVGTHTDAESWREPTRGSAESWWEPTQRVLSHGGNLHRWCALPSTMVISWLSWSCCSSAVLGHKPACAVSCETCRSILRPPVHTVWESDSHHSVFMAFEA